MDIINMQGRPVQPMMQPGYPQQMQTQQPMQQQINMQQAPAAQPVDAEQLRKWNLALTQYKAGKAHTDTRVRNAESWWKLRNEYEEMKTTDRKAGGFRSKSAWLHNVIVSKHADYRESYPEPNILPREEADKVEAWALSKIIPVILKQVHFERTYNKGGWKKLISGAGIYKVIWDANKLNGLGDINVVLRNILNIFWEPGIEDIQDSRYLFDVEWVHRDLLVEQYPDLEGKNLGSVIVPAKPVTDDPVPESGKVAVIDVYYKKKGKLHYCKYVGDQILYATENDPEKAETGLYDHGLYPYVFDVMYPVEGSPAGYGYVDICANTQTRIDLADDAVLKNLMFGCKPRFFVRGDGAINEEEFLDTEKAIVHTNGSLGQESILPINFVGLNGNYINVLDHNISELRETSGNTETSTGSSTGGVTAASAIAALQEASGKGSRASTADTYMAYAEIVNLVIELIRQFYDVPRQFRILGNAGIQRFISFDNSGMQPQLQAPVGNVDMGYRLPVYDIEVVPEKRNAYTKISQNELAIQLYGLGFYNPGNIDQSMMALQMMDFDQKDDLLQRLSEMGGMQKQLAMYQQLALSLAQKYEPELVPGLAADVTGQPMQAMQGGRTVSKEQMEDVDLQRGQNEESANVRNARERASTASQPGGSTA